MNAVLSRRFVALMLLAPLIGCAGEDVSSYTAPNDTDPGTGPVRVLVAIIPAGDDAWFIKLTGRNDIVEMVEPGFRELIRDLQFPEVKKADDLSIQWKTPKGWKEDRLKVPTATGLVSKLTLIGMAKPEMTISKLPASAILKSNIDRWRRLDLGLPAITPRALEKVVSEQEVQGRTIKVVDMRGPGGKGMPPTDPGHPPMQKEKRPQGKSPLKYKVPEGWRETRPTSMIAIAALVASDGKESAQILISPLGKNLPGGLKGNLDRWRGEVGLPSVPAAEVEKMKFLTIKVAGIEAKMLDSEGKEKRSLIVWFERGETTWFFKMVGPAKLVGSQKAKFEEFMKSVQFPGGAE